MTRWVILRELILEDSGGCLKWDRGSVKLSGLDGESVCEDLYPVYRVLSESILTNCRGILEGDIGDLFYNLKTEVN